MPQDGDIAINKRTGAQAVFQGGQWVIPHQQPADANMRGRLGIGLAPMVQAEQTMSAAEASGNPLQHDWGATLLDKIGLDDIAKAWGGQDYQNYTQAAKAFESQLMPIMSGAAVSPSEAARQIHAAMPELGDSKDTLLRKALTRKMMLNGAAHTAGSPMPYPEVNTFGVNTQQLPPPGGQVTAQQSAPSGAPGMPPPVDSSQPVAGGPQPGTIEDGYAFKGGNPADPANWVPAPSAQPR